MTRDTAGGGPAARGVNSARGIGRVWRAYAVEALGLLGCAAVLFFAVVAPGWSGSGWFDSWGFVAGLVVIPLVAMAAMVVASVRLRVAPVGLLCAALLTAWALVDAPWSGAPRWAGALVLAPVVAALATHPRPWGRGGGEPGPAVGQVSSTAR